MDLLKELKIDDNTIVFFCSDNGGYWAFNKGERWALVTPKGRPRIWDFGSAAKAHRLQLPSIYDHDNSRAGNLGLQGAIAPTSGLPERAVKELQGVLQDEGVAVMYRGRAAEALADRGYLALIPEMAKGYDERTSLNTFRSGAASS